VTTPGFGKALHQGFCAGVEEDDLDVVALTADGGYAFAEFMRRIVGAHVNRDRDPLYAARRHQRGYFAEKLPGQIVDTKVTFVLEQT